MRYIFNCCSAHFFFFKDFFDQQIFAIRIKLIIIPECRVERVHACMHALFNYLYFFRAEKNFVPVPSSIMHFARSIINGSRDNLIF